MKHITEARDQELADKIVALSKWIDGSYPTDMIGTELHARRRVGKIMEEAGEAAEALGGVYGENPRKGVTHTTDDLLGELLDVAITALGAYESLTENSGQSVEELHQKIDRIMERAGIDPVAALTTPEGTNHA